MNKITLVAPIVRMQRKDFLRANYAQGESNFVMTEDEKSTITKFLENRKKCLANSKQYYNAVCITDINFSLSGNNIITEITTKTLVINKITLVNVAFGNCFRQIVTRDIDYGLFLDCMNSEASNIKLPYLVESVRYQGNAFTIKHLLEKELEMKVLIDRVDNLIYIGAEKEVMEYMNDMGYYCFKEMIFNLVMNN